MKKFINTPENFIDEMLEGIYYAFPNDVEYVNTKRSLVTKHLKKGKVALATGGGSGHLPLFLGYVGKGMLDGCAVGDTFQSPSADEMFEVTKKIDQGAGVIYIYGNYNGDIFNFTMAKEMAEMELGLKVEQVIVGEDVASGPRVAAGDKNIRRGVAGIFYVYKCAGAAANEMLTLSEVKRIAEKVTLNVGTMGVAFTPCTVPRVGHPSFTIADDEMEIGMGIHGEKGIRHGKLQTADMIVEEILPKIIDDLSIKSNDEVSVLINGLGATSYEEQFVVTRKVNKILNKYGCSIYKTYVGEYATSFEMAGLSVTLFKLDNELKRFLDAEADTPFFKQFAK